jgi:pimeloyl-ACP methyl ester carboxylesterase
VEKVSPDTTANAAATDADLISTDPPESGERPRAGRSASEINAGEQNSSLSYLPLLAAHGIELAEIPHSGHWPMYSNPVAMWARIIEFHAVSRTDTGSRNTASPPRPG